MVYIILFVDFARANECSLCYHGIPYGTIYLQKAKVVNKPSHPFATVLVLVWYWLVPGNDCLRNTPSALPESCRPNQQGSSTPKQEV